MNKTKKVIDWDAIEPGWRAGIKTKLQLSEEYGVSRAAMDKHFAKEGIDRDLTKRIQSKVEALVTQAVAKQVTQAVTPETKLAEKQIVEANAEVVAAADLLNRKDVLLALSVSRSQLEEVAALCDPSFKDLLVSLGESCDLSTENKPDKANEMYRYIISLAGRVKMSKEIAASHGVYVAMQRKILKLDIDSDRSQSAVDSLMAKINAATD
jgi:hypothetical protein